MNREELVMQFIDEIEFSEFFLPNEEATKCADIAEAYAASQRPAPSDSAKGVLDKITCNGMRDLTEERVLQAMEEYMAVRIKDRLITLMEEEPILFPLSSLTKDIQIKGVNDGKPFIPIDELRVICQTDIERDFIYCIEDDIQSFKEKLPFAPYSIIKKLLELHFDIDSLIPDGLAIDVTTLEVNPYK